MGSKRMALRAGKAPETIPTMIATLAEITTDQMEIGTS